MKLSWRQVALLIVVASVVVIAAVGTLVLRGDGVETGSAGTASAKPSVASGIGAPSPSGPCLDKNQFEQVAAEMGYAVFERSKVKVTATTPVICEGGWVFANTKITYDFNGYDRESYILLHHEGKWKWVADTYWSGDTPEECPTLPAKIRSALRCP